MKVLEFTLSDFGSLQKSLIKNFNFVETAYHCFELKNITKISFFRRIFIESGFEVLILSAQFEEAIHLKQISSNNTFNAIHFLDFNGQFHDGDVAKNHQSARGVYITSNNINLNFKVNANEDIFMVSFIYSKRWLDINLADTLHFKNLFDTTSSLKKYLINSVFEGLISKIRHNAQNNKNNSFILKINVFVLFSNILELLEKQAPNNKKTKLSINDLIVKIEMVLSTDFETPISKLNTEITANGYNIKEFVETFKEKNNVSLFEFRKSKRITRAIELLESGCKIKETARKTGFKTDSKFIEYFKKKSGNTPHKYIKNLLTTLPS